MTSADDDTSLRAQIDKLPQTPIHQAASVLMARMGLPIEDAARCLFRVADEIGVDEGELSKLIVRWSHPSRSEGADDGA